MTNSQRKLIFLSWIIIGIEFKADAIHWKLHEYNLVPYIYTHIRTKMHSKAHIQVLVGIQIFPTIHT